MADLEIRMVKVSDVDAVHRIEAAAFPSPWRREFFESELRASGRFNLVAVLEKVVVGYLFSMWLFDEMHINKIAVVETKRRQGIAASLMDECLRFARTNRIRTISLEVRESNADAQGFYAHLDFASSYVRPRYYPDGEAAVVMTKEIV